MQNTQITRRNQQSGPKKNYLVQDAIYKVHNPKKQECFEQKRKECSVVIIVVICNTCRNCKLKLCRNLHPFRTLQKILRVVRID